MPSDQEIVRAAIHPAIGIARVGDSPDGWFVGPELPYPTGAPEGGYKDAQGALKRQVARFRIYGMNRAGEVVAELGPADAQISWTVHLANKKAAWYNFELALDIPGAQPVERRNPDLHGAERARLVIDPGPRSIGGINSAGPEYRFDSGRFWDRPVYLGELRTDEAGNLLVFGGYGVAASAYPNNPPCTYANNAGWHDDIADGPVSAQVTIGGRDIPVEPAWVVSAPPNFAPDIMGLPSLFDVVRQACSLWLPPVKQPSFTRHIYPILRRLSDLQWVNAGFAAAFGWDAPHDFTRPSYVRRLADPDDAYAELRRQLFHRFREPTYTTADPDGWPPLYGDDMEQPTSAPRHFLALTSELYGWLQQWAAGDFVADWQPNPPALPQQIEQLPLAERPATLDEAALAFCLGGTFHPGCELTWPMRHFSLYAGPFRIRPRDPALPEPDYGERLDPATLFDTDIQYGPLFAQAPGDLTRWMAVPWQTDSVSCRAGYTPDYDPYLPAFWPAHVPNQVLRQQEYALVMNRRAPRERRRRAFYTRAIWTRGLGDQPLRWLGEMAADFSKLGVVQRHPGPAGDPDFPPAIYVETGYALPNDDAIDRHRDLPAAMRRLRLSRRRRRQLLT